MSGTHFQGRSLYGQVPKVARKRITRTPVRNALGLEIRKLREEKNWSQSDFARELQLAGWDVERSVVTKIELRRRCITDYELLLMIRTLRVPLGSLRTPNSDELSKLF
jgi:transcriptional regulator with XRE-family HTH domain